MLPLFYWFQVYNVHYTMSINGKVQDGSMEIDAGNNLETFKTGSGSEEAVEVHDFQIVSSPTLVLHVTHSSSGLLRTPCSALPWLLCPSQSQAPASNYPHKHLCSPGLLSQGDRQFLPKQKSECFLEISHASYHSRKWRGLGCIRFGSM